MVISNALGFSPRLPVSVCGTVTHSLVRRLFSSLGFDKLAPVGVSPVPFKRPLRAALWFRPDITHVPVNLPKGVPAVVSGQYVVQEY